MPKGPKGEWIEGPEGPGLRWFFPEDGGGWRYNSSEGKIWKPEGGWRMVDDGGPCWKWHIKHTGKRQREEEPPPLTGSLLEEVMTKANGIGEPPSPPQRDPKRRIVPLLV